MARTGCRIAVAFVMAAALALPASSQGAFPGKNGKIAFRSGLDATGVLSTVDPDGASPLSLFDASLDAAWSPDGREIAFTRCADFVTGCDTYVVNSDGSGLKPLVRFRSTDRTPAWSPDGLKILFASGGPNAQASTWDTWVINSDGTGVTMISERGALEAEWSPDGGTVFFAEGESRYPAPGGGIWRMRPDGSGAVRLVGGEPDVIYQSPSISPDGATVAFAKTTRVVSDAPCCSEIFTMNRDGTDVRQITTSGASHVAWSPDGTKLVIDGLATINPDGTGLHSLGAAGMQPDWQPIPGPKRSSYGNSNQFCRAERAFWSDQFAGRYGGGANAFGKCVSQNH